MYQGTNLDEAVAVIKAGDKKTGGKILSQILKENPQNERAWIWLYRCVDSYEKKKYCLQKAIEINPSNQNVREALEKLTNMQSSKEKQEDDNQPLEKDTPGPELSQIKAQHPNSETFSSIKYFSALAGLGVMLGAFLPWIQILKGDTVLTSITGIFTFPGIVTFFIGGIIIVVSLFNKSKDIFKSSYNNGVIALLSLILIFVLISSVLGTYDKPCLEDIFGPNDICENPNTAGGYSFSMFSLFLAFVIGVVSDVMRRKSRKQENV